MTSFNQTMPSDTVFKVITNNSQSQYRNATTNFQSIPVLSQSTPYGQNITLMAIGINQTHPGDKIIETINTIAQPIPLQDNMTLVAVQLNETKPDDMILQLNASDLTSIQTPITLQFVPINQSIYRIEFLSANQTMTKYDAEGPIDISNFDRDDGGDIGGNATGPKGGSVIIAPGSHHPDNEKHFVPNSLTIQKGTYVEWTNHDGELHTVTSGSPAAVNSVMEFDSSYLAPVQIFRHNFDSKGTFDYYCTLHPFMTGKVVVK